MLHIVPALKFGVTTPSPVVRLLRIWGAARETGENPLPAMTRMAALCRCGLELATAAESCFHLTESCLGRRLALARPFAAHYAGDEIAMIELLRSAPLLASIGPNTAIPHGLPGALQWAAMAVVRSLGPENAQQFKELTVVMPKLATCPFGASAQFG